MTEKTPFDFDISVAAAKKRAGSGRRGLSGAVETSTQTCEHGGCNKRGEYKAPLSPNHLDQFKWFCRKHIGKYNHQWNYYENRTAQDAEPADSSTGCQPEFDAARIAWAKHGISDPFEILGDRGTARRNAPIDKRRRLTSVEKRALRILDLDANCSLENVRAQYRSLVKDLHPDMNGGDRSEEDRLKQVVWAWNKIRESQNFDE